jgi:two-component system, cell cycle response regulator CpdR
LSVNNDKNTIGIQQDSKVKVVDDDYDIAELVKMALQRDGFENVFAFTDPLLALEHFKVNREDYSLVISDIRMPDLNHGFEFAEYINKVKPEIKVILMSAFDINSDDIVKNFKYSRNMSGLIQKPISPKKLAKIVAGTKVIGV